MYPWVHKYPAASWLGRENTRNTKVKNVKKVQANLWTRKSCPRETTRAIPYARKPPKLARGNSSKLETKQKKAISLVWNALHGQVRATTGNAGFYATQNVLLPCWRWCFVAAGNSESKAVSGNHHIPTSLWAALLSAQAKWESLYCYTLCKQCEHLNTCKGLLVVLPLVIVLLWFEF